MLSTHSFNKKPALTPQVADDLLPDFLTSSGHVHCLGICGIGMAGLAHLLKTSGRTVSGCDVFLNPRIANWLRDSGIAVYEGHAPKHLCQADWVIRSTAVALDHPEIQLALKKGLPVFRRGRVLAEWLKNKTTIIVCGTHGKTTTTALLTQILAHCGLNPGWYIGGECAGLNGVAGLGAGQVFVVEADESDGTLVHYHPDIAILTNLEFDHPEFYSSLQALRACFAAMLKQTKQLVVYCEDDPEALNLIKSLPNDLNAAGYGFTETAPYRAFNLKDDGCRATWSLLDADRQKTDFVLPVSGRHNVLNAVGASVAAHALKCSPQNISRALSKFMPVARRFETVFTAPSMRIFSDYAHHPTEISAALDVFRKQPPLNSAASNQQIVIFQPHRYSRTRALLKDFAAAFAGIDQLFLMPVYPASEKPLPGGTVWDLYAAIRNSKQFTGTVRVASFARIWDHLCRFMRTGDDLLLLGAGDIESLARQSIADFVKHKNTNMHWQDLNPVPGWVKALKTLKLSETLIKPSVATAAYTTFKAGGPADIFLDVGNQTDLASILFWAAKNQVSVTCLGAGSNVLISDLGIKGLVLRLTGTAFRQIRQLTSGSIEVGAGMRLEHLLRWCSRAGLGGLEFLHGIPGTLGGALRMNAGAYGKSIGMHVTTIEYLNPDGTPGSFTGNSAGFAYRQCSALENKIAFKAVLTLVPDSEANIQEKIAAIRDIRRHLPRGFSAGSVFKNPAGAYAGKLLESAGCKGLSVGGARVSDAHANVIIADTDASATDIAALMAILKSRVSTGFDVELEQEIVYCE